MPRKPKVLVAMSGGVDSSVAAALLQREGYDVVGCFMRLGSPGESLDELERVDAADAGNACDPARVKIGHQGCCSINDAADARLVASMLGVPFYVCNFKKDFGRIIDYFVGEYNAGRTPNPCVRCNDWLKFGKLHSYARQIDAEYVASGHYARIDRSDPGHPRLLRGIDHDKDQSYVLFGAPRARLAEMLLPVGGLRKPAVRAVAEELGLPVFDKPDSQEICFVPDNDYAGLVRRRAPEAVRPGPIVDAAGREVGEHDGHQHFTIGQRRGVGVALGHPVYVVDKDPLTNTITIGEKEALRAVGCLGAEANWLAEPSAEWLRCTTKIRYNAAPVPARVRSRGDAAIEVEFDAPQYAVAPGQAVVCYDGEAVIAGAWITRAVQAAGGIEPIGISVTEPSPPRPRRRRAALLAVVAAMILVAVGVGGYLARTAHRPIERSPLAPAALAALGAPGRASGANLLLVTIDTVRADRIGCYGYTRAETPHIDRLAAPGVQFLQAVAPAPLTLPSHATMMTGLDVPSHGARDNGSFVLADEKRTLAEILAERGYETAAFVGAYVLDARYGLAQGFATYDHDVNAAGADAPSGHFNERPADAVTDAAIAWLDARDAAARERPFFAWVHYFDAHAPYEPPPAYAKRLAHPYDREIAFVDAEIGRLLARVEGAGPTLIVLAADHGEGLGEHGEETHSRLLYDSTMHVPLLLSCPTLFDRRVTVDDRVVSLADIFPTVLDLLGVRWEPPIDGLNLLTTPPDAERAVYIETMAPLINNGWASLHGLRRLDEKYILAPRPERYDLAADPGELDNLYPDDPAGAAPLAAALDARMEAWDLPERVLAQAAKLDPEQRRRLAALGYVQADDLGPSVGRLDPKDMLPLWQDMMRAQTLSNAGQHDRAAARMEKVLAESPLDSQAWSIAALVHKRRGRWDDAERAMKRSLELHPTAEGWVRLAQFMLRREAFEEADAALAEAHAIDPRNGQLYITRGDRLAMAGRFEDAQREFERALEVDPVRLGTLAREKIRAARAFGGGG